MYVPECYFRPGGLHPANPGDILNGRYEIKASHSWAGHNGLNSDGGYRTYLTKDNILSKYVCLRIYGTKKSKDPKVQHELEFFDKLLSRFGELVIERHFIIPRDSFSIEGPIGVHWCGVYDSHGPDLIYLPDQYDHDSEGNSLCPSVYYNIARGALEGLSFLHSNQICHGST